MYASDGDEDDDIRHEVAKFNHQRHHRQNGKHDSDEKWRQPQPASASLTSSSSTDNSSGRGTSQHIIAQHSSVEQYAAMFHTQRKQVLNELNQLPELANQHRLQMKIMFTVVVLSYRSVVDQVEAYDTNVFRALCVNEHDHALFDDQLTAIRRSVHALLQARALAQHAMDNAKQVTSQIWHTLFDYPSLKTCIRFNRFILDCVNCIWQLYVGTSSDENLKSKQYILSYDEQVFDSERHIRFTGASQRESLIKRYLWPAPVDVDTMRVVHKAVVIT